MQNILYVNELEKLEQLPRSDRKSLFFVDQKFLKGISDKNKDLKDLMESGMLGVPFLIFPPYNILFTLPFIAKKVKDIRDKNLINNQIEKFSKTIGSMVILPLNLRQKFNLTDITLEPNPNSSLYLIDPFEDEIYHSIETYNDHLMTSKFYETIKFFSSLGSKKIEVQLATYDESLRDALIDASGKLNLSGLKHIKSIVSSMEVGFSGKISTDKKTERQIIFKAEFENSQTKNNLILAIKDTILSLFKIKSQKSQNYINFSEIHNLKWFNYEPSWQQIYDDRINRNLKTVEYLFNFTNVSKLEIFLDLSLVFELLKSFDVNLGLDFGYKNYNLKDVKFYFNVEFF